MQQRFLLQILLLAQHVSGTTMPIIRSWRVLYSGCCLWYFVLWFSSCWYGVELRVVCPVCRMLQHPANRTHNPQLMGIVVPETCWASNKNCNKNLCCIQLAFYFHIWMSFQSKWNQQLIIIIIIATYQPPTEGLFPVGKEQDFFFQAYFSSPYRDMTKSVWSHTSTPLIRLHGAHRDKLTFTNKV